MLRLELLVRNSARFNGDKTLFAVDTTGVAEGVNDEATTDKFEVGLEDLFAERLQQHGVEVVALLSGFKCLKILFVNVYEH